MSNSSLVDYVRISPNSTNPRKNPICGNHYRRKVTRSRIVWICATYNTQGKAKCPSKAIPENKLQLMASDFTFDDQITI